MTYLHQGIRYSDNGAYEFIVSDAPGNALKGDGWARDSLGRGYVIAAPQAVSYRHQGRSYTANGALIVNSGSGAIAYSYDGYNFDANGSMYLSGVSTDVAAIGLEGSTDNLLMETGDVLLAEGASEIDISAMSAATTLGGTETVAGVQTGTTVKITIDQIKTYVNA